MGHLFDAFRAMDRTYWRWFFRDATFRALFRMAVIVFFADLLWFLLTPKEVRERQWNEF